MKARRLFLVGLLCLVALGVLIYRRISAPTHLLDCNANEIVMFTSGKDQLPLKRDTLEDIRANNLSQLKPLVVLEGAYHGEVDIDFSRDGKLLARTGLYYPNGNRPNVMLWDLTSDKCFGVLGDYDTSPYFLKFGSTDSLVIASSDNSSILWDVSTRSQILQADFMEFVNFPAAEMVSYRNRDEINAHLWNTISHQDVGDSDRLPLRNARLFAPDGNSFVTTDHSTISLWNTKTLKKTVDLAANEDTSTGDQELSLLLFSPDGKWFAAGNAWGTVDVWDAATGVLQLQSPKVTWDDFVTNPKISFTSDSRLFAHNHGIWDVKTGSLEFDLGNAVFEGFNQDQSFFATLLDGTVQFRDLQGNTPLFSPSIAGNVKDIAFDPNGKLIAFGVSGPAADGIHDAGWVEIWGIPA